MTTKREMRISVARDFTPYPGPRYIKQGPNSGERFRKKVLVPALEKAESIVVDLDGTTGFGSSFLDEAFGGLISVEGMSRAEVEKRIRIKSDQDATYHNMVWEAVREAKTLATA